jgi:hypothetical protein
VVFAAIPDYIFAIRFRPDLGRSSVAALLGADAGRFRSIQITWRLPTFGQWAISDAAYGLTVKLSKDLTGLENHVHQA